MSLTLPEGRLRRVLLGASPWLFFVALIAVWEVGCRLFSVPAYILPAPSVILNAFFDVEFSRWMQHLWATLRVALLGFLISIAVSIPIAIAMMRSEWLSRTLYPLLVVIQSTPVVAVAPLIIVIMGSDDPSRILITCLLTFFPLVVSTATGINETPPELIELSRSLDAPAGGKPGRFACLTPFPTFSVGCGWPSPWRSSVPWWRSSWPPRKGWGISSSFPPRSSGFPRRSPGCSSWRW